MRVITLTTCHNRRECTLASLEDLHRQALPGGVHLGYVLVDDGCTDGTADAVRERFADVEIVSGGGNLYWAGGMRHGWEQSVRHKSFDYLFVYNDDVRLDPSALADLIAAAASLPGPREDAHVIVGSFLDVSGCVATYGGRRRSSAWHPLKFGEVVEPDGHLQPADTLNMNGALISRGALDRVGFLSRYFVHAGADFEYGLKLRKAGGAVHVAPGPVGRCDTNTAMRSRPENAPRMSDALRILFDRKREPVGQRFAYYRRHGGALWPVLFASPYVTIWFRYVGRRLWQAASRRNADGTRRPAP